MCQAISPVTVFVLVQPWWKLATASLITLFRPWVNGLVLPISCTFALHPSHWLPSLLISVLAQLARDSGVRKISYGSQEITRVAGNHADLSLVSQGRLRLALACLRCQARTPLINRAVHGSSQVQFLHKAEPSSCLTAGGAVADPALVPPFHPASVSRLFSLIS